MTVKSIDTSDCKISCPDNPPQAPIPIKEALLELVWPTRCVGCESLNELLCHQCQAKLKPVDIQKACPRCGAPYGQIICTECYSSKGKESFSFSQAVCALEFEPISARMVVLYKNGNEHRLANNLAAYLSKTIPSTWFSWADCISWIPADKKTLRRRGFDHMQVVARQLAKSVDKPVYGLLKKAPVKDQRELDRQQRRQNLQNCFSYLPEFQTAHKSPPAHILLIDDVFTTGATLDIASQALLSAGVKEVRVAAFTRVW